MKQNKSFLHVITIVLTVLFFCSPALAAHCDVKAGDSMHKIAKRYKIHFFDVLEANKHYKNPHLIHPNDKVYLPEGNTGEQTKESSKTDNIEHGAEKPNAEAITQQARDVLQIVNAERQKAGLQPLTLDAELCKIANVKAADMRDNNYFSHDSARYGSPFQMLQTFGRHYTSAGENIAAGQKDANAVMTDWLNSSGHRANILNANYKSLGVGYVTGGSYGSYWVQEFTTP